jgi:hypothetical protein
MSISERKAQISHLKMRVSQLDQFGYEEESAAMTESIKVLEAEIEFEQSQLELARLLKEKEEKTKRTYRRRRKKKVVEEDVDE